MRMLWWMRGPLFDAAAGDAGGGAGAGAGSGAGSGSGDGGQSGAGGTFDAGAFKTELMGEVNKALNGFSKSMKTEITKLFQSSGGGSGSGGQGGQGGDGGSGSGSGGTGSGASADPIKDPAVNAKIQLLEKQLETLRTESEQNKERASKAENERLESERRTYIKDALGKIKFRSQEHRELFFNAHQSQVTRDDDGNFVVQTERGPITADQYLADRANSMPDLLEAKGEGGSGARGSGASNGRGTWVPSMDDLEPETWNKLSKEQQLQVRQHIAQLAKS